MLCTAMGQKKVNCDNIKQIKERNIFVLAKNFILPTYNRASVKIKTREISSFFGLSEYIFLLWN